MKSLTRAWERTREPLPCQYDRDRCIRCGKEKQDKLLWKCEIPFYGPGDLIFRVSRFLNLRTCDPCHARRTKLNLLWYKFTSWITACDRHR